MGKIDKGYEVIDKDKYYTPSWVTEVLLDNIHFEGDIWEPAAGNGAIARILERNGILVNKTDIDPECSDDCFIGTQDFLTSASTNSFRSIITNPPYGKRGKLAEAFIQKCLYFMFINECDKFALLLPIEFDYASTRKKYFDECPYFAYKIVITKRIQWENLPKTASPMFNHAWFIWEVNNKSIPRILYS